MISWRTPHRDSMSLTQSRSLKKPTKSNWRFGDRAHFPSMGSQLPKHIPGRVSFFGSQPGGFGFSWRLAEIGMSFLWRATTQPVEFFRLMLSTLKVYLTDIFRWFFHGVFHGDLAGDAMVTIKVGWKMGWNPEENWAWYGVFLG